MDMTAVSKGADLAAAGRDTGNELGLIRKEGEREKGGGGGSGERTDVAVAVGDQDVALAVVVLVGEVKVV
jgi:hypothetical protein